MMHRIVQKMLQECEGVTRIENQFQMTIGGIFVVSSIINGDQSVPCFALALSVQTVAELNVSEINHGLRPVTT